MGDHIAVSINKKITEYKALVFDLDGTLYFQRQLRLKMAWMLGSWYLCHFWRIKELFIIKRFREIREQWGEISGAPAAKEPESSLEWEQYSYVADRMGCTAEKVKTVVETWM